MRDILHNNRERFSEQSVDGVSSVFFNRWINYVRHILEDKIKMIEGKTLYLVLTIIGVPTYIYTYFIHFGDIVSTLDWIKTATLSIIVIGAGLFFLVRSFIKTLYEVWDLMDKYKKRNQKEKD